jgi:hypothetical protein
MRKTMAVLASTVAAAGLVAGGLATASASSATSAASGTEHFSLMTTSPSASKYVIIASGVFTGGGVDKSGNTTDTAKFANGSFKIHHGGKLKILKEQVNQKTCLAMFVAKAKFTLGGGTGAYKGISGSGTATISELAIAPRSKGQCNPNANPLHNEETISATGHVKL